MDESTRAFYCACRKSFPLPSSLTLHKRSCSGAKKRLATALDGTRDLLKAAKKCRLDALSTFLTGNLPTSGPSTSGNLEPGNLEDNDIVRVTISSL